MKKIISIILAIFSISMLCSCEKKEEVKPDVEQLKAICELSTIEVYYNNVAKSTKDTGNTWWKGLKRERKFWIEYEGVAEIGIDMKELSMEVDGNTVYINMPKAKLLNTRITREKFDENSYVTNSDNWWFQNKITTEDQKDAVNKAQSEMCNRVMENKSLFERAEKIAKDTIQNYFDKINDIAGSDFIIEWR